MLKHRNLIFIFILLQTSVWGQYSEEYNSAKASFPDAKKVTLNDENLIYITLADDEIKIQQTFFEEHIYLDESATYGSDDQVSFSSFFELESIEASSHIFKNGKYKTIKVNEYLEKDNLDNSFYDDSKTLSFIYPNLNKGAKTTLNYSEDVKNPRFLSPFFIAGFNPIMNRKISLVIDNDITISFKEFNTESLDIAFTKDVKRKTTTYTWQISKINEYDYESKVPSYKSILPHIIPIINSYKTSLGETVLVLGEVSNLYQWYFSLTENVNKEKNNEELVAVVNNLVKDKKTEIEKVRAIYYWAQKNIKYIAFEYALGGFIPREANEVFEKKYGDCKDNSSILSKMLEIAEIEGNLTWIGTRDIPYKYAEVPTPIVDNHMILSYTNNDDIYFLDATGRFVPLEYPTSFIQGKEALVATDNENFKIVKVPIVPTSKSGYIDNSEIKLIEGNLIGTSKSTLSGYLKANYFHALENKNDSSKLKTFYNSNFSKGNNTFLINSFKEENKYEYDKDFLVSYNFKITDYVKSFDDEIYINLNLNKVLIDFKSAKERKNPIENDFKCFFDFNTKFEIPEGYVVNYIPENSSVSNEYISSKISYKVENNQIIYNHYITLDYLTLSKSEQIIVNKLIKEVEKQYKEIVVLKKKSS